MKKLEQYIYENIFHKCEINEKLKINKDFISVNSYDEIKKIVKKYCVFVSSVARIFDRLSVNARDCGVQDFIKTNTSLIVDKVTNFWKSYKYHYWLDIDEKNMTKGMTILKNIIEKEEIVENNWDYIYDKSKMSNKQYDLKILNNFNYGILIFGYKTFRRIFVGIENRLY